MMKSGEGTCGRISSHNATSRDIRHTFDTDGCFNGLHNSETLEQLQHIRANIATFHQGQRLASALFIVFLVFKAFLTCAIVMDLLLLSVFFVFV